QSARRLVCSHVRFFLYASDLLRAHLSFPTRRSSDLVAAFHRGEIGHLALVDAMRVDDDPALGGLAEDLDQAHDRQGTRSNDVGQDRKSTRLNSSHLGISYAVFRLQKKKTTNSRLPQT